jgi:hypothetical protein
MAGHPGEKMTEAAQHPLYHRAKGNSTACFGGYSTEMEK